jgi:hypothetical protein
MIMIHRAATSYESPEDASGVLVLCVHALDDADLPRCRGVKREDLTDVELPWEKWAAALRCSECERSAPPGT